MQRLLNLAQDMRALERYADSARVAAARQRAEARDPAADDQPGRKRLRFRLPGGGRPRLESAEGRRRRVRDDLLRRGEHPGLSPHVFDEAWEAAKRHDAGEPTAGDPDLYRLPDGMTERAKPLPARPRKRPLGAPAALARSRPVGHEMSARLAARRRPPVPSRSLAYIATMTPGPRETLPRFVAPMLLAPARTVPDEDSWALEVKWDGMRAQARIDNGRLRLRSRRGVDWTLQFPDLSDLPPSARHRSLLLDCELVCFDATGHPDFARLRTRLTRGHTHAPRAARNTPATLIVFDVLHLDGHAVRRLPYRRRRELLDELALESEHWKTPPAYPAGRDDLAAVTRAHGLEGVVAKRYSAPYMEGRRAPGAWRKLKHRHVETLIVTAWEPGAGRADELLVSRHDPESGRLRNAGRVPLSLSPGQRATVRESLAAIERPQCRGRVRPLEPLLAADIAHHGRHDSMIRDPILKTFRPAP